VFHHFNARFPILSFPSPTERVFTEEFIKANPGTAEIKSSLE